MLDIVMFLKKQLYLTYIDQSIPIEDEVVNLENAFTF